jgi:hypothetical protein
MKKVLSLALCIALCSCTTAQKNQPDLTDTIQQNVSSAALNDNFDINDWKTFSDSLGRTTFKYPANWNSDIENRSVKFKLNNKDYHLAFFQGYGLEYDSEKANRVKIGNYTYMRTEYMKDNQPFLVGYLPIDTGFAFADGIEAQVPSENSEYYLKLFDKIVSTIVTNNN